MVAATGVGIGYYFFRPNFPVFTGATVFLVFLTLLVVRLALTGHVKTRRRFSFLTIPLLMLGFWATMQAMFDDFNIQAIIYHATHGFSSFGIPTGYMEFGCFILAGIIIISVTMSVGVAQSRVFSRVDIMAAAPLILFNPLVIESAQGLGIGTSVNQSLTSYYKPLATLTHDQSAQPNILHIFLESTERTLANEQFFGPAMRSIMEFEKRGLSATNIQQIKNTEWTKAGMVASNCGLPLIQPWLVASRNLSAASGRFLPNAKCLGEVLKADGYRAEYIMGVDVNFAGTGSFYLDHGFSKVTGFDEIYDDFPSHLVENVLGDSAVFAHSEKTFRQLSKKIKRFC